MPEKQKRGPRSSAQAYARAQTRAFQDLSRMYPEDYRRLYVAQAILEGVKPRDDSYPRQGKRLAS